MVKLSYIIGRAGDITLYDDTVSRRHASLELHGSELFLRDLDSRNGTYEIRDNKLVPFKAGAVTRDQVFAFGECVRSVVQLLAEIDGATGSLADTAGDEERAVLAPIAEPMDATTAGIALEPRKRMSAADIVEVLELIEDRIAAGQSLATACAGVGINEQRYSRWCREYGATRASREDAALDLRRENERLRRMLADLALERDVLKDKLQGAIPPRHEAPVSPPSLTVVGDNSKLKS